MRIAFRAALMANLYEKAEVMIVGIGFDVPGGLKRKIEYELSRREDHAKRQVAHVITYGGLPANMVVYLAPIGDGGDGSIRQRINAVLVIIRPIEVPVWWNSNEPEILVLLSQENKPIETQVNHIGYWVLKKWEDM